MVFIRMREVRHLLRADFHSMRAARVEGQPEGRSASEGGLPGTLWRTSLSPNLGSELIRNWCKDAADYQRSAR
jgi:hypothetical protein